MIDATKPSMRREQRHLAERFDFRGHSVAWDATGEGPPAVLLHGTPFSSLVWRRIVPWLAPHRRIYRFDLLGYGLSAKPDGDVSRGIQNELFAALLDHWRLDRPDIVAHDFGGSTALRSHILNGRDYRSLVLIDPVAISPQGSPLVEAAKSNEAVFAELPSYVHEAILRAYLATSAARRLHDDAMQLYLDPWLGEEGQRAFWRQVAQMSDGYTEEIEHRYAELRCPVTILWGEEDAWIPLDDGRELARRIPGATFHAVPNAGHLMQEDAPEAITATVLDVWRRLEER